MASLDEKLGEINGALKALIPALRAVEERLADAERLQAAAEKDAQLLRAWVDELSKSVKDMKAAEAKAGWAIVKWVLTTIGGLIAGAIATAVAYYLKTGGK